MANIIRVGGGGGKKSELVKVWENPSQTGVLTFAGQAVTLSKQFDHYLIVTAGRGSTTPTRKSFSIVKPNAQYELVCGYTSSGNPGDLTLVRKVTIIGTTATFGNAMNDGSQQNKAAVPMAIYGITNIDDWEDMM